MPMRLVGPQPPVALTPRLYRHRHYASTLGQGRASSPPRGVLQTKHELVTATPSIHDGPSPPSLTHLPPRLLDALQPFGLKLLLTGLELPNDAIAILLGEAAQIDKLDVLT